MRNLFIDNIRMFIYFGPESYSFYYLGVALHPVVDTYIPTDKRIEMLNYYSYDSKYNIINGQYIIPYEYDASHCTKAVKYIYNAAQNLASSASDAEIGAIFDGWLKTVGGGYGL